MATVLLVEDAPDLGLYEAFLLEAAGHRVIRCGGGPTPFAACPMLRHGSCPLPDSADLILFSCRLFGPMPHRTYRGTHLLRSYRAHPRYGRLPMLVVSVGMVDGLEGSGPLAHVDKFSSPDAVIRAVDALLAPDPCAEPMRRASGPLGPPEEVRKTLGPGRRARHAGSMEFGSTKEGRTSCRIAH